MHTQGFSQATFYRGLAIDVREVDRFLDIGTRRRDWHKEENLAIGQYASECPGVVQVLFRERSEDHLDFGQFWEDLNALSHNRAAEHQFALPTLED